MLTPPTTPPPPPSLDSIVLALFWLKKHTKLQVIRDGGFVGFGPTLQNRVVSLGLTNARCTPGYLISHAFKMCCSTTWSYGVNQDQNNEHRRILFDLFLKNIFWGIKFFFFILYSALLHLPPLRFHCADGCWDRTQDRCNWCIGSQTF